GAEGQAHDLLVNGVQKPVSRYEAKFMQKCRKPFSQNFSSYSKLSDFFTTSSLNGVQKLTSAVISLTKRKI
ncbi:hypothetical protein O3Q31_13620, partial [Enterococcus lactis]